MQTWHDVSEVGGELGTDVVTIGNFDGVHLGHRHVVEQARVLADERGGLPVVVVTFDPHPLKVVAPDVAPQALSSLSRRLDLLAEVGADAALVLRFTPELAAVSAEHFVTRYLLDALHAEVIVVGDNFRFGHRALGDVGLLRSLCEPRGVAVVGLALDGAGGETWSSSYIRRLIDEGDVRAAAMALGRCFTIEGYVVRGDQRGRELGYPTANVPVSITATAVPADGVYAGWLRRLDAADAPLWPAAISVGTNPTFNGVERRVESYVLDRDDLELYGVRVEVTFVERLRGMVRFESVDELVAQMGSDVDLARDLLSAAA
ncbi:MAG: bifunctional riboflavin kinase/FAD synthetase [Nocardioidaceae bacterium]